MSWFKENIWKQREDELKRNLGMVINMDSHIASLLCMSTFNRVNIQTGTVFSLLQCSRRFWLLHMGHNDILSIDCSTMMKQLMVKLVVGYMEACCCYLRTCAWAYFDLE